MPTPGDLLRDARRRHGLDQRTVALRAGTSQTQVSRIERGEISPSVSTLARLLAALGERLELGSSPAARPGATDFFPDHASERRRDALSTTPAERIQAAIDLSRTATTIASLAHKAR